MTSVLTAPTLTVCDSCATFVNSEIYRRELVIGLLTLEINQQRLCHPSIGQSQIKPQWLVYR